MRDQPIHTPVRNPITAPNTMPLSSSRSEYSVDRPRRCQSSWTTSIRLCGGAKKGGGSAPSLAVSVSHSASSSGAATSQAPPQSLIDVVHEDRSEEHTSELQS